MKSLLGEHDEAISLQNAYLDICVQHEDRAGEASARASLATSLEKVGQKAEAKQQLETLLVVAADAGETKLRLAEHSGILFLGGFLEFGDAHAHTRDFTLLWGLLHIKGKRSNVLGRDVAIFGSGARIRFPITC